MTVEKLTALAERLLSFGVEIIQKNGGDLHQQFHLVHPDGGIEIIVIGGCDDPANWDQAKTDISKMIRAKVKESRIVAVMMLSDTWYAPMNGEQAQLKQRLGLSISEMAELGLCEASEAVYVSLESPVFIWMGRQSYKRSGQTIDLVGDRVIESSIADPTLGVGGRFSHIFRTAGPTQ